MNINNNINSQNPRERILNTALELFSINGFTKTSTRKIADLAKVNLSSIKYYFGDKKGLYEAAFTEPVKNSRQKLVLSLENIDIKTGLKTFFSDFLTPLSENKNIQFCVKIHMREMFEPTGVRDNKIDNNIKPYYIALVKILQKELKAQEADTDIERLAFSLISMAVFLYFGKDIITEISPQLLENEKSISEWSDRMNMYAIAMINAENKRRYEI